MIELLSKNPESGLTPDGMRQLTEWRTRKKPRNDVPSSGGKFQVHRLSARLSTKQLDTIIRRYEQGDSATAIASNYDVAPSALLRLLRERGVVVRKGAVSIEQAKQMAQEYEAGATMADLERKYGLSHGVVHRALHKVGVEARDTGRPSRSGRPPRFK